MSVKQLPKDILPREKALRYGVEYLDIQELLAIILRSGTKQSSVLDISAAILKKYPKIHQLNHSNMFELCQIKGVSKVKALVLLSAIELSKRINREMVFESDNLLDDEVLLMDYLINKIGHANQEQVLVLFLNHHQQLISDLVMFKGSDSRSVVSTKMIMQKALLLDAKKIILAHNHPSGCVIPSSMDLIFSANLAQCCKLLDIDLLDHIIVSNHDYLRLKDYDK